MTNQWNLPKTQNWLKICQKEQQEYHNFLGRNAYTKYKPSDYNNLKRIIGYAIYDKPNEEPTPKNEYTGYDSKQLKLINSVFKLLQECKKQHNDKDNIIVSIILISIKIGDSYIRTPVFRIPKTDDFRLEFDSFIDTTPRVYSSWQDYLDNNKLPNCLMCYPRNGRYSSLNGEVQLDKCISPEGQIGSKVLKGLDITSSVVQFAGAGVGIASLFVPMALPVLLGIVGVNAVTGAYASGRSIAALRDRDVHHQSIGLDNAESRNCYLGIVGSVVGVVSGGATAAVARTAQAGETLVLAGQVAIKGLAGTSCAVNLLGVANGVANIVEKAVNKEEVTSLDLFQLTSSILFFTSSVVSVHQARQIMRNISADPSDGSFLNQIRNLADRSTRSLTGVGEINVWNGLTSFAPVLTSSAVRGKFSDVCKSIFEMIFKVSELLWRKLIDLAQYKKEIGEFLRHLWESWQQEIAMVVTKVCESFGIKHYSPAVMSGFGLLAGENTNFVQELARAVIIERRQFQNMMENTQTNQRTDPDTIGKVIENVNLPGISHEDIHVAEVYENAVLDISGRFAELQEFKTTEELTKYFEFVCRFVRNEFEKHRQNYEKTLLVVKKYSPDVTPEDFNKEYGIPANKNSYFLNQVLDDFKKEDGFFQLKLAYDIGNDLMKEADEYSNRLSNGVSIDSFFNEVGRGEDGNLSREQYYEKASQMIRQHVNEQSVSFIEDCGTAIMCVNGVNTIIIVKGYQQEGKVSGLIVMVQND